MSTLRRSFFKASNPLLIFKGDLIPPITQRSLHTRACEYEALQEHKKTSGHKWISVYLDELLLNKTQPFGE